MRRVPGGCAPNIAYSLALLGEKPLLWAAAGKDAREYRERLEGDGVDVSGLVIFEDVFTASFFVSTDQDQNQIASFYTGAMARARELSLLDLDSSGLALVVVSPNDPAAMARYTEECRQTGVPFVYDPSQQVARLTGEELSAGLEGAFLLIANDYEFGILIQKTGLSAEEVEERVPVLVLTHGPEGSSISVAGEEGRSRFRIPAAPVEAPALDPTGVGDAFRAGLFRGMRLQAPWPVAGRMGSVAAVFGLESAGPQPGKYSIEEFHARYRRSFGEEPLLPQSC